MSAVPTFPRKENELVMLDMAKTLKEVSVKMEREWLEGERRQRQMEKGMAGEHYGLFVGV